MGQEFLFRLGPRPDLRFSLVFFLFFFRLFAFLLFLCCHYTVNKDYHHLRKIGRWVDAPLGSVIV